MENANYYAWMYENGQLTALDWDDDRNDLASRWDDFPFSEGEAVVIVDRNRREVVGVFGSEDPEDSPVGIGGGAFASWSEFYGFVA